MCEVVHQSKKEWTDVENERSENDELKHDSWLYALTQLCFSYKTIIVLCSSVCKIFVGFQMDNPK